MSVLDNREEYKKYNKDLVPIYGDFTTFYEVITLCTLFGVFLIVLNVTFCWCSQHSKYWKAKHTGNRFLQPLWTVTPHNNPPLDLSELEEGAQNNHVYYRPQVVQYQQDELDIATSHADEYIELHKRESEI